MAKENQRSIPFVYKLLAGIIGLIGMFAVAMLSGAAEVAVKDIALAMFTDASGDKISMIRDIRLPREIAAVFVGSALAVSGAIMQGITRNPLADPGLLGLTAGAGAALAAAMAFAPTLNYFALTLVCFTGAAIGAILVFGIGAMKKGGLSPIRIVLAGAAVSTFLYAVSEGIGILFKISKDVSMWTAGGLIGTTWGQLQVIVPFITLGIAISLLLSRQLTILSLSEEVAAGLGQKIKQIRSVLIAVIILLAGASVALVGNLAFIGLMVPHIVRAIVGTDYRFIIPMSAVSGAVLMLFADTLGRTVNSPYEAPVAAIVAMMGLPFFLLIARKGGKTFS
ncbi:FecCD family ABC transporter permease [Paenibacillus hamazuiensis]|uniref:FecCD family ABC transporter permease n=1 Tax=Paenibacillus hamazuiensis TaxID=2936508 RepID=UPI00200EFDBB|nr:iron ABC transporter permease [Paenibacillus hamazuiensis]